MTPSLVFTITNMMVLPMWLLMLVAPKWRFTRILIDLKLIPLLLALIYAIYILISLRNGESFDFGSLESVMALFTKEQAVLAGWMHYLAFDLLVGMWMINQNRTIGINPLIMAPCLMGTFMLGPVGFLLFMLIKTLKSKKS